MTLENFIPEIWAAEVQRSLEKSLVYGQIGIVNRDYEGEIASQGNTVRINQIGPVTVKPYTKNTDIDSPETLTDAQQVMLITEQDYFNFMIDDIDKAQQKPKVMQGAMAEASYAMRDSVDQFIASLYTDVSANNLKGSTNSPITPNNTAGDPSNIYNIIVDCGVLLDDSKCPLDGRWMIVPPWFYGKLLKDDRFSKVDASGTQAGLRNGIVGMVDNFEILRSHNVPNTTNTKYKILFGSSKGITFANQINKVEPFRPEKRFADAVKGLNLYGAKVVRPECVGTMTCNSS